MAQIRVEKRYHYGRDGLQCTGWVEIPSTSAQAVLDLTGWLKLKAKGAATSSFAEYRIITERRNETEEWPQQARDPIASDGSIAVPDNPNE